MSMSRIAILTGVGAPSELGRDLVSSVDTEQFGLSPAHTDPALVRSSMTMTKHCNMVTDDNLLIACPNIYY